MQPKNEDIFVEINSQVSRPPRIPPITQWLMLTQNPEENSHVTIGRWSRQVLYGMGWDFFVPAQTHQKNQLGTGKRGGVGLNLRTTTTHQRHFGQRITCCAGYFRIAESVLEQTLETPCLPPQNFFFFFWGGGVLLVWARDLVLTKCVCRPGQSLTKLACR